MTSFFEEQKFTQIWLRVILALVTVIAVAFLLLVLFEIKAGLWNAIWPVLIVLCVTLPFRLMKLSTTVSPDSIGYRFFPFHMKFKYIKKSDIQSVTVGKYSPLKDYGGWGIRLGRKGWAYTIKGSEGISIFLKKGKQILIGTSKPQEADRILRDLGYPVD